MDGGGLHLELSLAGMLIFSVYLAILDLPLSDKRQVAGSAPAKDETAGGRSLPSCIAALRQSLALMESMKLLLR